MSTILRGEMTRKLIEPFPPQAIQTRQGGGGKRLSYVEGHTVIHRLIAATDNQFDLRVLSVEQKGDLLTALVELTIPGLGSRQHMGVQKVAPNGGEDLVKGAITDAMKKAATLFGVGLELYGPDYEADDQTPPARDTRAAPNAPARPAAPPPAGGPPPTIQEAHLAFIRDPQLDRDARKRALHLYYGAAESVADLNRREMEVAKSGMDPEDLRAGYKFHHSRLFKGLTPHAGAAG